MSQTPHSTINHWLYPSIRKRNLITSVDTPFNLMVSHFIRNLKRCALGFSKGCPTKLVPFYEGDECRAELKIISLDHWANNTRRDARCLQQSIVPQHAIILLGHHHFCLLPSSCFFTSPLYSCFYLRIEWNKVLVPLASPVYTKQALPRCKQFLTGMRNN